MLVTCVYEGSSVRKLPGTNNDVKEMMETFIQFGYETVQLKNEKATKREITFVLKQISQYLSHYRVGIDGDKSPSFLHSQDMELLLVVLSLMTRNNSL